MKGQTFTSNVKGYVFEVEITHYCNQLPLGLGCDSDYDCYGYTELEFKTLAAYSEEGDTTLSDKEATERGYFFREAIVKDLLNQFSNISKN